MRGGVDRWDRAGGVGRQEQDEDMTNEQNIERRKLAVEVEETVADREKREVSSVANVQGLGCLKEAG